MSWVFDELTMEGVEELNWGRPVTLIDLPNGSGQLAIGASTDTGEPVLIDLASLLAWLHQHRPDLLLAND